MFQNDDRYGDGESQDREHPRELTAVLEEMLRDDARVLEDPAPRVWVSRLEESWAEVKLWPWTRTEDWWSLYSDLPQMVRLKLVEVGIEVPVPRRDVTMRSAGSTGGVSEGDG